MLKKDDFVYIKKSVVDTCHERGWYGVSTASSWVGKITRVTGIRKAIHNKEVSYFTSLTCETGRNFSILKKDLIKLDFVRCLVSNPDKLYLITNIKCFRGQEIYLLGFKDGGEIPVYTGQEIVNILQVWIRKLFTDDILIPVSKSKKKIKFLTNSEKKE